MSIEQIIKVNTAVETYQRLKEHASTIDLATVQARALAKTLAVSDAFLENASESERALVDKHAEKAPGDTPAENDV